MNTHRLGPARRTAHGALSAEQNESAESVRASGLE